MKLLPLFNVGIQVVAGIIRYLVQIYTFAQIDLDQVGEFSLLLAFVTSITILAGCELHHHLNRPILLGETFEVRGGIIRIIIGSIVSVGMALAFPIIIKVDLSFTALSLLALVAIVEYVNLELSRLLIISQKYLLATIGGALRSIAPFLVGFIGIINFETVLLSWFLVSTLVAIGLLIAIIRMTKIRMSRLPLTLEDIKIGSRFFVVGGIGGLYAFGERAMISWVFDLEVLGIYALIMIFVGATDMLFRGGIWQPFLRQITANLVNPTEWKRTASLFIAIISLLYGGVFFGLAMVGNYVFDLMDKPLPPLGLIGAVLAFGATRAIYTVIFQIYYARYSETVLPYMLITISITVMVIYGTAWLFGWPIHTVVFISALAWLLLPLLIFKIFPPSGIPKKAF